MSFFRSSAAKPSSRGFTLTELALVLAIIGLVLGAIWLAARSAYEGLHTNETKEDMMFVVENVRSLYSGQAMSTTTATAGTDKTTTFVSSGVFPDSMLIDDLPYNEWGGRIYIRTASAADGFRYYVEDIPNEEECIRLVMATLGAVGLRSVLLNNNWTDAADINVSDVNCPTSSDGYTAAFEFLYWPSNN